MYHARYVIPGLCLFVALLLLPTFLGLGKHFEVALEKPIGERECVEDVRFMRERHMRLLADWRDEVVRRGERVYTNARGQKFVKSMSKTCLGCHTDKAAFCDRCHAAAGAAPDCWNCHIVPPAIASPAPALAAKGGKP